MAGPELRYTNERAREMERNVKGFAKLVNDDLYDLLKWAETLRMALAEIAATDPVDAALDPGRAMRIATEALDERRMQSPTERTS